MVQWVSTPEVLKWLEIIALSPKNRTFLFIPNSDQNQRIRHLELWSQHFLRGQVSESVRTRHLPLCIFQACRPWPLPSSLPPSVTNWAGRSGGTSHASCASGRCLLRRYLSRLDGRRRPPVSFLQPQLSQTGAQPEVFLWEPKGNLASPGSDVRISPTFQCHNTWLEMLSKARKLSDRHVKTQ